jgi:hypothetical protein
VSIHVRNNALEQKRKSLGAASNSKAAYIHMAHPCNQLDQLLFGRAVVTARHPHLLQNLSTSNTLWPTTGLLVVLLALCRLHAQGVPACKRLPA